MIAPVIVVFHEARQGALEFPRATVLLELDDVLHRPVVAFDLSLRHVYVVKPIRTTAAASQERLPAVVPCGAASSDSLSVVLVTFAA